MLTERLIRKVTSAAIEKDMALRRKPPWRYASAVMFLVPGVIFCGVKNGSSGGGSERSFSVIGYAVLRGQEKVEEEERRFEIGHES